MSTIITRKLSGLTPSGVQYNAVTWRRQKCKECGQRIHSREYRCLTTKQLDEMT